MKGQLTPKYIGPFEIIEIIGYWNNWACCLSFDVSSINGKDSLQLIDKNFCWYFHLYL
jgi:hypothetical protein